MRLTYPGHDIAVQCEHLDGYVVLVEFSFFDLALVLLLLFDDGLLALAFDHMPVPKEMNRLTLRGKNKVNIQWMLYCMVHNIGKIVRFGLNYGFT
jgi:hypothetical protein